MFRDQKKFCGIFFQKKKFSLFFFWWLRTLSVLDQSKMHNFFYFLFYTFLLHIFVRNSWLTIFWLFLKNTLSRLDKEVVIRFFLCSVSRRRRNTFFLLPHFIYIWVGPSLKQTFFCAALNFFRCDHDKDDWDRKQ